jgi:ABC-type glycerol-3-phosphate transport system substrate-binding protein
VSKDQLSEEKMMRISWRARTSLVAVAALAATSVLAACGSGGSGSDDKKVSVWLSVDPVTFAGLKQTIVAEAKKKGITVDVQKVDNINQLIMTKIQAHDTPDIAAIPQPGVVADMVKRGAAKPLDDVVDMKTLKSDMIPGTLEAGTVDGKLYGLLVNMNIKSLVFYPKQAWDKAGYKAPDSLDALTALGDQIKKSGTPPWCFAIGSDAATGWPATDWFEDLIMQQQGPEVYKDWVTHKVKFDSPEVKEAAAYFAKTMFTGGNVAGGRNSIASTAFGDADNPMWDAKPGCMMLKQGNFIVSKDFLPADVVADVDKNIGVFGFPPAEAGGDNPTLGGGDMATLLTDKKSAKDVMKILADPDIGAAATKSGSPLLSPHKSFDPANYPNDLTRSIADVAKNSTQFLYDGSDSMPGAVGAGTFWKDMTAWITGDEDLDTALKNIDSSWPTS